MRICPERRGIFVSAMFWEDLARAEARVDVAMLAKLATQEGEGWAATVQRWSAMGLETSNFPIFIPTGAPGTGTGYRHLGCHVFWYP